VKKQNLIIQAAVAGLFAATSLSAVAGIANGFPVPMAAQAVASNATTIGTGSLAYSTQSPIAAGTAYVYVKLNNGALFSAAPAAGDLVATSLNGGAVTTPYAVALSTDSSYAIFTVPVTTSLPVNVVFTFKPTVPNINNALTAAAGGGLTGTMSIGSTSNATTPQADIDSMSTGTLLNLVNGEAYAALQSGASNFAAAVAAGGMAGAAVETKTIDVVTSTGVAFTAGATSNTGVSTTLLNFGGYAFSDIAGVKGANATSAFNLATDYTGVYTATLTGNFTAAQGTGGAVFLSTSNACAAQTVVGTINTAGTSVAFAGIPAAATGIPKFVCMQINTPGNTALIPTTTPSLAVTLVGNTGVAANITPAAANLYALSTNGATHKVMTYIPSVDGGATGYTSYIRVINTGGVAANISGAFIDPVTGAVGTAGVIATGVAAGGAVTLSSTQVEAGVGSHPAAGTRPRLQLTGPTTFTVQSFLLTDANGNFAEVSGSE